MAAVFISHSSLDNDAAQALADWLVAEGHGAPFLDLDPTAGLLGGAAWEQQLYQQLRACRVLLLLWSAHAEASSWVFAEVTHARALGKQVLPLRLTPTPLPAFLNGVQHIDAPQDRPAGWVRLRRTLDAALGGRGRPAWTGERPPYPGLMAFDEADAPVYFGRDAEQRDALAWVTRLQRFDGPRFALVLGASGSGKSSLLRAGLLPALRRQPASWRLAGPLRPQRDPWGALTRALAQAFPDQAAAWADALAVAAGQAQPDTAALAGLLHAGLDTAATPAPELLLVIDQFEELLDLPPEAPGQRLKALLARLLALPSLPLRLLATLRSDMLARLQTDATLGTLPLSDFVVGPMAVAGFAQVIEGPAAAAGLLLEPGLAAELVADTATPDALPLLAFTLRALWERAGPGGPLTLSDYRQGLGRLDGAVARAAETVLAAQPLDAATLDALRSALTALVRLNDDGACVRQQARWDDLPVGARGLLQRFIDKRLLLPHAQDGVRLVELAHDALLRSWQRLADWLAEDRALLQRRDRLRRAAREWEAAGRGPALLVHRGGVLDAAVALRAHPRFALDASTRAYLDACVAQHADELRQRQAQERAALEAAQALAAERQRRLDETLRLRQTSIAQALAAQAPRQALAFGRHERAALLARQAWRLNEAHGGAHLDQVDEALRAVLSVAPFAVERRAPRPGAVRCLAWSADGRQLLAGGQGWLAELATDGPGPWRLLESGPAAVTAVVGAHAPGALAWGTSRGELWWRPQGARASRVFGRHAGGVSALARSPDGRWLASAGDDGRVRLWRPDALDDALDAPAMDWPARDPGVLGGVVLAFSGDGRWLAAAGPDRELRVWDLARLAQRPRWRLALPCWPKGLAFHPQAGQLVAAGDAGWLAMVDLRGTEPRLAEQPCWMVEAVAASADGVHIALGLAHGEVALLPAGQPPLDTPPLVGHEAAVSGLAFSPDGRRLASADQRGRLRLWDLGPAPGLPTVRTKPADMDYMPRALACRDGEVAVAWDSGRIERVAIDPPHQRLGVLRGDALGVRTSLAITGLAYVPGRDALVSAAAAGDLWCWDLATTRPVPYAAPEDGASTAAVSTDGRWLAACERGGRVALCAVGTPAQRQRSWTLLAGNREAGLHALALHPQATELAVGSRDGRLWRLRLDAPEDATPPARALPGTGAVNALAYSPDGAWLASAGDSGLVQLLAAEGTAGPAWRHERAVSALAFSPDSAWLASACADGMVRLWRLAQPGHAPVQLRGHDEAVVALAFADAGRRLVSIDLGGTLRVWQPWTQALADRVCQRVWRNLDSGEWAAYVGADLPWEATCAGLPPPEDAAAPGAG